MAELGEMYETTRASILEFVASCGDLDRPVPATPGWTVKDVVAHLTGDAVCVLEGDFPVEFFQAFGSSSAVAPLNEWTADQVEQRRDRSLQELIEEWDEAAAAMKPFFRGEQSWPEGVLPFADTVLNVDLGVHQQDLYGTFGVERDQDSAPVRLGVAAYVVGMGWRLQSDGGGSLRLVAPENEWAAGSGEPTATVRAGRFELFRALSGRRSMDQVRAYDWDGDPEPFLKYFYPYGIREAALVE